MVTGHVENRDGAPEPIVEEGRLFTETIMDHQGMVKKPHEGPSKTTKLLEAGPSRGQ